MIRIAKPVTPDILQTRGTAKRAEDCTAYDTGIRQFDFDDAIYADKTVKKLLVEAQHGKCAFCESYVADDGHIEHFRPKSAVRPRRGGRNLTPGYYWLAYDWDNLLLCCATCNQKCKQTLFPLADETRRARSHSDDVSQETALLIQPVLDDPADYLTFNKYTAVAVADSAKGRETIDALKLNRDGLVGRRIRWYAVIQNTLRKIVELENHPALTRAQSAELVTDLLHELSGYTHPEAEFSAMAQAALQPNGL